MYMFYILYHFLCKFHRSRAIWRGLTPQGRELRQEAREVCQILCSTLHPVAGSLVRVAGRRQKLKVGPKLAKRPFLRRAKVEWSGVDVEWSGIEWSGGDRGVIPLQVA